MKSQPHIQQLQENTDLINFKTDCHCTWELMSQETFAMHADKHRQHRETISFDENKTKALRKPMKNPPVWNEWWFIFHFQFVMCRYSNFVIYICYDQTSRGPIRTLTMLNSRSDPQDPRPQIQILKAPVLILLSLRTTDQFAGLFFPQNSHSFDNLSDASAEI